MRTNVIGVAIVLMIGAWGSLAEDKPDSAAREPVAGYFKGVIGSAHDFSAATDRAGGACDACHVPHVQGVRQGERPGAAAIELFRIQGQRQVFVAGRYTPGPTSLICLGCHDGTVATSTIGSSHALLAGVREGFQVPDGFVWRDHPIGIEYATERKEYRSQAYALAKGVRLPEGRLECVSCHDPHNQTGEGKMLVMSNRRSALCLACHIK